MFWHCKPLRHVKKMGRTPTVGGAEPLQGRIAHGFEAVGPSTLLFTGHRGEANPRHPAVGSEVIQMPVGPADMVKVMTDPRAQAAGAVSTTYVQVLARRQQKVAAPAYADEPS